MKCPIDSPQPEIDKPLGKPKGSRIGAQIRAFFAKLDRTAGLVTTRQQFELDLRERFITLAANAASKPVLDKHHVIQDIIAKHLGIKSLVQDAVGLRYTKPGQVRKLLSEAGVVASNMIELIAVERSLPSIRKLYSELKAELPSFTEVEVQKFLHDHIVVGQLPVLKNIYDSPIVHAQLDQRYNNHIQKLVDAGVSVSSITVLDEAAYEISKAFDYSRFTASKYGLGVKALENGGYFPLQATEEIKRFLEKAAETAESTATKVVFDSANILRRSRNSLVPGVVKLPEVAKILGLSVEKLYETLLEPNALSRLLQELPPATVERLVNTGVLFQMPAMSDELLSFFKENLELPIDDMAEAIILDPIKAFKAYNEELKSAVANSAMLRTVLQDGVQFGWIKDASEIVDPKDYVKLGSNALFQDLFTSNNFRDSLADSYIHRTVASQMNALFNINTSYSQLGMLGAILTHTMRYTGFIKKGLIVGGSFGTFGLNYVGRVLVQDMVALNAAVGADGMAFYSQGLADATRMRVNNKGLEALDNTQKHKAFDNGQQLTDRALYEQLFLRTDGAWVTGAGERVQATSWEDLKDKVNVDAFRNFVKKTWQYQKKYGSFGGIPGATLDYAKFVGEMFSDAFNALYEALAIANQFLDTAAKWTAAKVLIRNPSRAGGRQTWASFQELKDYIDEYFNINTDAGTFGAIFGQLGVPFASIGLVAPGSMIRHAIRHPIRYARMMMLYSQAQESNGKTLTDGELSVFQKEGYPLFVGEDENGKPWSINPLQADYFLDSTQWITRNLQAVARSKGETGVGSALDGVDSLLDPTADLRKAFNDTFEKFYLSEPLMALIAGTDSYGNVQPDVTVGDTSTLLGVGLPSKRWRSTIVSIFPLLRTLDEKLPTPIVGSTTELDPITGKLKRQGEPTWTGLIPTTGGSSRSKPSPKPLENASDIVPWLLQTGFGLTLSQVDPERNLISNYRDFGERTTEINKSLATIRDQLAVKPEVKNSGQLKEARDKLLKIRGIIKFNQLLIEQTAVNKGYTTAQALDYVRSKVRSMDDVPDEDLLRALEDIED